MASGLKRISAFEPSNGLGSKFLEDHQLQWPPTKTKMFTIIAKITNSFEKKNIIHHLKNSD